MCSSVELSLVSILTEKISQDSSVVVSVLLGNRAVKLVELADVFVNLLLKRNLVGGNLGETGVQTVGDAVK